ncbi:hypothetical protein J437_LFUL017127 [Ladona fulva]|uniref:DOCKER domain-containing protein n=1 Tax=Ladona fulva TaxID=123851 RepID=A0A8K0KM72_LADFU|nr:hypothetical protein J437_LFUL017127 [Ladona fulva]
MLQMVLQGCIGTTVNQGPKEVAVVFLSDLLNENAMPTNFQNRLRDSFKDFAKYCYDGLRKNEKIMLPEQICYQQELEKNFWKFIDYLEPLTNIKDILYQEKG